MKTRIITGIILIGIIVAAVLLLPVFFFSVFAGIVVFVITLEWAALANARAPFERALYVVLMGLVILGASLMNVAVVLWTAVAWWAVVCVLLYVYKRYGLFSLPVWVRYGAGFIVIAPAWVAVLSLVTTHIGLLLYLIAIIAAGDSGAYFIGRYCGRHKLAPAVSPKKTMEGLLGGLGSGGLVAVVLALFLPFHGFWCYVGIFLFAALIVAVSVVGDLFESMIKREADVKDSGFLLPGHGGFLDRTDSLLAALPPFALIATGFMQAH